MENNCPVEGSKSMERTCASCVHFISENTQTISGVEYCIGKCGEENGRVLGINYCNEWKYWQEEDESIFYAD